jgi:hypothetical protein
MARFDADIKRLAIRLLPGAVKKSSIRRRAKSDSYQPPLTNPSWVNGSGGWYEDHG